MIQRHLHQILWKNLLIRLTVDLNELTSTLGSQSNSTPNLNESKLPPIQTQDESSPKHLSTITCINHDPLPIRRTETTDSLFVDLHGPGIDSILINFNRINN